MKANSALASICVSIALLSPVLTAEAQPVITNISAGLYRSLFIMGDGSLWGMGENGSGALGIRTSNNVIIPVQIVPSGVIASASGGFHSLFVKSDGSLWGMGNNQYGQLGDGSTNSTNGPALIWTNGVAAVAAGVYHSLVLKTDSSLWGMGYNHDGQLGDGSFGPTNQTNRPEYIDTNVVAIAAGNYHSLYQKTDGSLWGMGYNAQGALGTGNFNSVYTPVEITNFVFHFVAGGNHSLFFYDLENVPNLWAMGDNSYGEFGNGTYNNSASPEVTNNPIVDIFTFRTIGSVVTGSDHSLFLGGDDNSVRGMGRDDFGQLGDSSFNTTNKPTGTSIDQVQTMAAGAYHSMFLKFNGNLWNTGYNADGELGNGTLKNVNTPELIVPGNLVSNGDFETGDFTAWSFPVPGHSDIIIGDRHPPPDQEQYTFSGDYAAQFSDIFLGGFGGSTESVISQSVPTQPGASYLLSFWLDGIVNSSFSVSWNGTTLANQSISTNLNGPFGWTNFQFVVAATGTNTALQFQFPGIFDHQPTTTALDAVSVVPLGSGFNRLAVQLLNDGDVQLTYMGRTYQNYVFDRATSLTPSNWVPQFTNYVGANGLVIYTNTPAPNTPNFWRVHSAP